MPRPQPKAVGDLTMGISYLDTARDIHGWLSSLQVKQKWIDAELVEGQLAYDLVHPSKGKVNVWQPPPSENIFRAHGVALELGQTTGSRMRLRVYDFGGIWDPIDNLVPGEHYATTHFALLSAILFSATKEPSYLEQAIDAMDFHLHTSSDEYKLSNWMYHWDFQNYAFVAAYELLEPYLPAKVKTGWEAGLRSWQTNHRNKLANWAAMRALAHLHRYKTVGSLLDLGRYRWNLRTVAKARHADGCIDDHKHISRPIQYHIYAVALLHRIFLLNRSKKMMRWFMAGVDYLLPWIDPDGDFNYWGRGQEQIFGYAAAIYALQAAALGSANRRKYQHAADLLFRFLLQFKTEDHFPLVLNARPDEEQFGWYDYHHTTVYNAFLGAWLGLAHSLTAGDAGSTRVSIPASGSTLGANSRRNSSDLDGAPRATTFFKPTQFVFLENEQFYCALGAGLKTYLSEVGLTPCHLWMKGVGWLFSCPGGPTADTFGKLRSHPEAQENFLAPLAILPDGKILNVASGTARLMSVRDQEVVTQWQNGVYQILRKISLSSRTLRIDDEITFTRAATYREFRFMSFPVVTDKFTIEFDDDVLILLSPSGVRARIQVSHDFAATLFKTNPRIRAAKGEAQVIRQSALDFRAEVGMVKQVSMAITSIATASRRVVEAVAIGNSSE